MFTFKSHDKVCPVRLLKESLFLGGLVIFSTILSPSNSDVRWWSYRRRLHAPDSPMPPTPICPPPPKLLPLPSPYCKHSQFISITNKTKVRHYQNFNPFLRQLRSEMLPPIYTEFLENFSFEKRNSSCSYVTGLQPPTLRHIS